jgi:predicted nucleotidyltransferase
MMQKEARRVHRRSDPNVQSPDPLAGDPSATIIWDMVETIVREAHPPPLAVILFGSRAQRTHRPTSDADLLVVVPEGTDTRQAAAAIDNRLPFAGVDVDIVAATPSRLIAARGDYSSVLHWAQERGVTLYENNGDGTPPSSAIPAASKAT